MAETQSVASFGTILAMGADPTKALLADTYTDIIEMHDLSGPGLELSTIEATHHLSPNATREHTASLKDLTEMTFEIAFLPQEGTHGLTSGFLKAWQDRERVNWKLTFTDAAATTWGVKGFVTGFEIGAPLEGLLTANVTIKLTGTIYEDLVYVPA